MFVITAGRGNIDLSIPNVLTLSAYVSTILIRGDDSRLWLGVLAALDWWSASSTRCSCWTSGIPAIIATLATGYILATASLFANKELVSFGVGPTLEVAGGVPGRRTSR